MLVRIFLRLLEVLGGLLHVLLQPLDRLALVGLVLLCLIFLELLELALLVLEATLGLLALLLGLRGLLLLLEPPDLLLDLVLLLLVLVLILLVLLGHQLGDLIELLLEVLLLLVVELLGRELLGELLELLLGLLEILLLERIGDVLRRRFLAELGRDGVELLVDLVLLVLAVLVQCVLGLREVVQQLLLRDLAVLGLRERLLDRLREVFELGDLVAERRLVELFEQRLDVRLLVG